MRPGSAMDLEATVCLLQSLVHSSRTGISPCQGGTLLSRRAQPHEARKGAEAPGRPQEGAALGLCFTPPCLKLRSGFWAFTFCGEAEGQWTPRQTAQGQTDAAVVTCSLDGSRTDSWSSSS